MKFKLCNCQWEHAFDAFKESTQAIEHHETCPIQIHAAQLDGLYLSASARPQGL